ncbi:CsbD family protein [Rhodotorula paludigena]|uniref:CsbD family protein n=1 Tax=Rhodotorula paludigena TaxID=86838 RepID=UPI0031737945
MSASNEPSKANANYDSTVGSIKATVGDVTGITSLSQSGNEQRAAGDAEYKLAQAEGYGQGTADRIGGKIDRVVGAATGDKAKEAQGLAQEEKGKAQQGAHLSTALFQLQIPTNLPMLTAAANS